MERGTEIEELADEMDRRHAKRRDPFLLFLGRATGRAADVPTIEEIAYPLFTELLDAGYEAAVKYISKSELEDESKLSRALFNLLGDVSSGQRYRLLHRFYKRVPIPSFYQNLAELVKSRYFTTILTTNFHMLLEQALNGAGLLKDRDYRVIHLGLDSSGEPSTRAQSAVDDPIRIIKILDATGQYHVNNISEEHINHILGVKDRPASSYSPADAVIIGYEFECEPVNRWLTATSGSKLWWVGPDLPDPSLISPIGRVRDLKYVNGPSARLEVFFGQLALMLLDLSGTEALPTSAEDQTEFLSRGSSYYPGRVQSRSIPDDNLEAEYLRSQLRRSRELLYELEQIAQQGEKNVNLQTQINYQRRQVIQLEDKLRSGVYVLSLVNRLVESMEQTGSDPSTLSFLRSQREAVEKEYFQEGTANHHIVSAAISALIVVASRLGLDMVEPELVRELTSYAPSTVVRQ